MAVKSKNQETWLNHRVLEWARNWRGKTIEEAAQKVDKSPQDIEAWEKGDGSPTVRQARILAAFYGRPFLEFIFSEIPKVRG